MSKEGTLKIHSENILPIIKKWLYSDKDIFVRELVSNSCDALSKLKVLAENGQLSKEEADESTFKIEIEINKEAKTLTFKDNGIGMDADEVEKYIAQLAFSGAEDFVKKYKNNKESDQIIGHFGLGFYSAYMVAQKVTLHTLSYKPEAPSALWICDGSSSYTLEEGTRTERGTEITLYLDPSEEEYLDPAHLRKILTHYCSFLPYPIFLNGSQINEKAPLWIKPASECTDQEYLDFYHHLFPYEPDPLFWVHLNVDYPFHLKGILYFPKISKEMEIKKESIKLFCNRVFVSDNCKDLLPDYLTILRGAIDSPDIPLNVSRSSLQMDRTVRQLGSHISKKISDRLSNFYQNEREKFLNCWNDIELIVKFGALQDDKFYERVKDVLVWKTLTGSWTTLEEYLERNKPKTEDKVYYVPDAASQSQIVDLFKEKEIEALITHSRIDQALIQLLEKKTPAKFQRIDASLVDPLLDPSKEKNLLDAEGKTERVRLAEFVKQSLGIENLEVEAKSLSNDSLPALLIFNEEQRRMRDTLAYHNQEMFQQQAHLFLKPTLVMNTNNTLVEAIYEMRDSDAEMAKALLQQIYDLSLLAQKEISPEALNPFVQRSMKVLEALAVKRKEV